MVLSYILVECPWVVEDLNLGLPRIQLAVLAGLELGASRLQVQRSNRSSTLPPQKEESKYTCTLDSGKFVKEASSSLRATSGYGFLRKVLSKTRN